MIAVASAMVLPSFLNAQVDTAWVRVYDGPRPAGTDNPEAMDVDSLGYVYVTGASWNDTGSAFATLKYAPDGAQQWVARYNGPGNGVNYAIAMAVHRDGSVYVGGWGSRFRADSNYDYVVVKYSSAGTQQWAARYNGPGDSADVLRALALDTAGNVYVTGRSYGSGTGYDYATVKYNSSGAQQWVARYSGPADTADEACSVTVDDRGNVYVTGASYGRGGAGCDCATIKYNTNGAQQWVARYHGPADSSDGGGFVAVTRQGNVYVAGVSRGLGTGDDYLAIKYDSGGVIRWATSYNGPGNSSDDMTSCAVDGSGNLYVTGYSIGAGTKEDYGTVKFDSNGTFRWAARFDGAAHQYDFVQSLALDRLGNVYVTGYSWRTSVGYDYATVSYRPDGIQRWVVFFGGEGTDEARELRVDLDGCFYVTGLSDYRSSGFNYNFVTVKYVQGGVSQPRIWIDPLAFSMTLQPNQTKDTTLVIGNSGSALLSWGIDEVPPANWLSESPANGGIAAGNQMSDTIGFNSAGLSPGTYLCTLRITSNDPVNPVVNVPVQLTVDTLPDLDLLPVNVLPPIHYLYLANRSALWKGNTTNYPWTDKEFIGAAVVNSGSADANNVHVRCYVDGLPVATDTVIPHLGPGDTALVDRMWMLGGPCNDNRLVKVRVDPDNTISETDETNNDDSEVVSVFYAQQNQSPNRMYDLRTDTYGQFVNFDWNLYDLWLAFQYGVIRAQSWGIQELAMLGILYTGYALLATQGGHCYGMAATPIHYFDQTVPVPPPYQTTYSLPLDVAQPDIVRYHVTQFFDAEYIKWCYYLTDPNREYSSLRQFVRDQHEPAMLNIDNHATTCYKIVERGSARLAYFYDNNDNMGQGQSIPANLVVFDASGNISSRFAYETPFDADFQYFVRNPHHYPYGFPYFFPDPSGQKLIVRRPTLEIGDWARALLWLIWQNMGGGLITEGKIMLTIGCPVKGLVTDSRGRRIGFVGDSLVNEIPGATIDTGLTVEVYELPDSLAYSVRTAAYDTGNMSVRLVLPVCESTVRVVTFDTIPLLSLTKADVAFARYDTSFRLAVDWDGNGTTDTTFSPDFNDTISVRGSAIEEKQECTGFPVQLALHEPEPNPFTGSMSVGIAVPDDRDVSLVVYDILGRPLRTLTRGNMSRGEHRLEWNATDDAGRPVARGVYLLKMEADGFHATRKLILE